jgi:hypothetical protein
MSKASLMLIILRDWTFEISTFTNWGANKLKLLMFYEMVKL